MANLITNRSLTNYDSSMIHWGDLRSIYFCLGWSEVLYCTIQTHLSDLRSKIRITKFYVTFFSSVFFELILGLLLDIYLHFCAAPSKHSSYIEVKIMNVDMVFEQFKRQSTLQTSYPVLPQLWFCFCVSHCCFGRAFSSVC